HAVQEGTDDRNGCGGNAESVDLVAVGGGHAVDLLGHLEHLVIGRGRGGGVQARSLKDVLVVVQNAGRCVQGHAVGLAVHLVGFQNVGVEVCREVCIQHFLSGSGQAGFHEGGDPDQLTEDDVHHV